MSTVRFVCADRLFVCDSCFLQHHCCPCWAGYYFLHTLGALRGCAKHLVRVRTGIAPTHSRYLYTTCSAHQRRLALYAAVFTCRNSANMVVGLPANLLQILACSACRLSDCLL
jgi:hypothetical protein